MNSADPLSDDAMIHLLSHHEEDQYVDYKLTMHNDERVWLEFIKDVIAFANTFGGYLVFGVEDSSFEVVGLSKDVVKLLTDVNNLRQKLNRYIEPEIKMIRSKSYLSTGKQIAILYVLRSDGLTHIVSKDGAYHLKPTQKYQKGKPKIVLRMRRFGKVDARSLCGGSIVQANRGLNFKKDESGFRDFLIVEVNRIGQKAKDHHRGNPGVMDKINAFAFDCNLYARNDKYRKAQNEDTG